jgi:hypothetical protein
MDRLAAAGQINLHQSKCIILFSTAARPSGPAEVENPVFVAETNSSTAKSRELASCINSLRYPKWAEVFVE